MKGVRYPAAQRLAYVRLLNGLLEQLILSLPQNFVDLVEQMVLTGLRQGSHVRDLERSIKDKLAIAKQKAQLIARDQVSKYSGDLTKHHQTYAGIKQYTWQTSRDERARPEHRVLDGQVFDWDKPPVSEKNCERFHPRQGYRCRCDAIPVVGR